MYRHVSNGFLADQLTLSRPGGGTLSPPSTARPPRFSDLETCLISIYYILLGLWTRLISCSKQSQQPILNSENKQFFSWSWPFILILPCLFTKKINKKVFDREWKYCTRAITTSGLYILKPHFKAKNGHLRGFFAKFWPYVWLVFKSGLFWRTYGRQ